MNVVIICSSIVVILQLIDYCYHRRKLDDTSFYDGITYHELRATFSKLSYKSLDNYFAVLPFLWTYLLITVAVIMFIATHSLILKSAIILFVTGRYRALQEIGHFAIHGALCPNMKWGLLLTNIFYQFPLFMPEANLRRQVHVKVHHHSVNMAHDPDLKELIDKRFVPGISSVRFWLGVFYPLTWRGIKYRIKECLQVLFADKYAYNFYLRISCILLIISIFIGCHAYSALFFLYFLPVIIIYPQFYWLAHIVLHRWYANCDETSPCHEREIVLGRPTEFRGILGFVIRHNIFPFGDSYHLAHSLFPMVRWSHLPKIDKILKKYLPGYIDNQSFTLLISRRGKPSALSELKQRMTS